MKKTLICVGLGSTGKISLDIIKKNNKYQNYKILDLPHNFNKIVLKNQLKKIGSENKVDLVIGFANIKNLKKNEEIYNILKASGYNIINVFHYTSIIDPNVKFGKGVKVFPGAIINRGCKIRDNVLINTGAIIEHDCIIGNHSQISPGCILAGNVKIGKSTFIGMGSKILQGINIGKNSIIGAGSVVLKNIPDNSTYVGVPAIKIK